MDLTREKEFLGIHPARFVDDVANAAVDYTADCLDQVEDAMLEDKDMAGLESMVQRGVDNAHNKIKDALDVNFDRFELYVLRNVFKIPDGVDLSEMQSKIELPQITHGYTKEQEDGLDDEISALRRKIRNELFKGEAMQREHAQLNSLLGQAETLTGCLDESQKATGVSPEELLGSMVPQAFAKATQLSALCSRADALSSGLENRENVIDPALIVENAVSSLKERVGFESAADLGALAKTLAQTQDV